MAENISETRPPEPPPRPPEVPKPTEQPERPEAPESRPRESPQTAQQEARDAAQVEHAKATNSQAQDGQRPAPKSQTQLDEQVAAKSGPEGLSQTPGVLARLDERSSAKNGPEGLPPTPGVQERWDAHTAAKTDRDASAPSDSDAAQHSYGSNAAPRPQELESVQRSEGAGHGQRSQDSQAAPRSHDADSAHRAPDSQAAHRPAEMAPAAGDRNGIGPAEERSAAREAAAVEWTKATEGTGTAVEGTTLRSPPETGHPASDDDHARDSLPATPLPVESRTAVDQTAQRQADVDEDGQRQTAADENAGRQGAVAEDAPPSQTTVEASPQRQSEVDLSEAAERDDVRQSADEHQPPSESTDETAPPADTRQPARRDSRGREIPDEVQRLPSGRLPSNWHYAGRVYDGEHWTPDLAAQYPDGVRFTNDGFPDFGPYATHTVTFDPQYQGNTTTDFTNANRLAGLRRTPTDYTWHHHQDTRTMQLVPLEIHDAVRHAGGRAILR